MKKLAIIAALMAATSAFAADVSVSGGVGASTNFIYRGQSLSQKNPSVNADAHVGVTTGLVDLFGNVQLDSISKQYGSAYGRLEGGLAKDLGPVRAELGFRENSLFGGVGSTANTREAFVRGSALVGPGVASAEYNKEVQGAVGPFGRQAYTALGYSMNFTPKLNVGASAGWMDYNKTGTKFNDFTLHATYALTDKVDVIGTHSTGGKSALNTSIPSQTSVGIRYKF